MTLPKRKSKSSPSSQKPRRKRGSTSKGLRPRIRPRAVALALAHSKVTAQGQVSVPAKVRQRLGVGPGSVLEWDEDGDRVVVRKAGRYSSKDIHRVLFSKTPRRRTLDEMKNGVRRYIKRRHAGR